MLPALHVFNIDARYIVLGCACAEYLHLAKQGKMAIDVEPTIF